MTNEELDYIADRIVQKLTPLIGKGDLPPIMDVKRLSAVTGFSKSTIHRMMADGMLKYSQSITPGGTARGQHGSKIVFMRDEVEKCMKRMEVETV